MLSFYCNVSTKLLLAEQANLGQVVAYRIFNELKDYPCIQSESFRLQGVSQNAFQTSSQHKVHKNSGNHQFPSYALFALLPKTLICESALVNIVSTFDEGILSFQIFFGLVKRFKYYSSYFPFLSFQWSLKIGLFDHKCENWQIRELCRISHFDQN